MHTLTYEYALNATIIAAAMNATAATHPPEVDEFDVESERHVVRRVDGVGGRKERFAVFGLVREVVPGEPRRHRRSDPHRVRLDVSNVPHGSVLGEERVIEAAAVLLVDLELLQADGVRAESGERHGEGSPLVVDGVVKCSGKVPTVETVVGWLKEA